MKCPAPRRYQGSRLWVHHDERCRGQEPGAIQHAQQIGSTGQGGCIQAEFTRSRQEVPGQETAAHVAYFQHAPTAYVFGQNDHGHPACRVGVKRQALHRPVHITDTGGAARVVTAVHGERTGGLRMVADPGLLCQ